MHLDMDSFYASVEMRDRPELTDKPLVIGADPKGGEGRGVVMTCNYAARKFGIKSAMPISRAYKLCPQAVFLLPNMALYAEVSSEVMNLIRGFSDKFQQVSIDEAFLDVSDKARDFDDAERLAMRIKNHVLEREKLTCSIGIGENKLIAKMASDINKPDGLTAVKPEGKISFLKLLPVEKIPGVGPKTREVLESHGIKTIGDLQNAGQDKLIETFGQNHGIWLYEMAQGTDNSPVEENYELKSINRNITFDEDTDDLELMHKTIEDMAKDVFASLQEGNLCYKTVTLRVRFDNFETFTRAKSLPNYGSDFAVIVKICNELLEEFLGKRKIRQLGVRVSNLAERKAKQKSILEY